MRVTLAFSHIPYRRGAICHGAEEPYMGGKKKKRRVQVQVEFRTLSEFGASVSSLFARYLPCGRSALSSAQRRTACARTWRLTVFWGFIYRVLSVLCRASLHSPRECWSRSRTKLTFDGEGNSVGCLAVSAPFENIIAFGTRVTIGVFGLPS